MKNNLKINSKTNITTFNRSIASILLISQLLTSCGGFGEVLPGGYPSPSAAAAATPAAAAPPTPSTRAYTTPDITYDEAQEVQKQYLRCPVEGYEIATIERIESKSQQQGYDSHVDKLDNMQGNPKFNPTWEQGPNAAARRKVAKRLQDYVTSYGLTKNPNGVKELKLWHGTDPAAEQSIMHTGFANLALLDEGFFGKGLYFTPQAEYVHRVYGKGMLLLTKVSFYSAYPVAMHADMDQLKNKGNYRN